MTSLNLRFINRTFYLSWVIVQRLCVGKLLVELSKQIIHKPWRSVGVIWEWKVKEKTQGTSVKSDGQLSVRKPFFYKTSLSLSSVSLHTYVFVYLIKRTLLLPREDRFTSLVPSSVFQRHRFFSNKDPDVKTYTLSRCLTAIDRRSRTYIQRAYLPRTVNLFCSDKRDSDQATLF